MYKEKKRDYSLSKSKDYMAHPTPEKKRDEYEAAEISEKYKDTAKDELLYRMANRPLKVEEEDKEEIAPDTIKILQKDTIPQEDIDELKTLRCTGSLIIGNLFDRVKYLENRISELMQAIELRKQIHEEMITDIDADIRDKETLSVRCADFDDLRSIKLQISMLKQQKRRELLQHFHDTVELGTELRALKEEFQSEQKIASIFDNMRDFNGAG